MSLKALKLFLAQDVQSTITLSASDVFNANPGLWASPADVPPYCYRSLGAIWIGSTASSSELATRIVHKIGIGAEEGRGEITLLGNPYESSDVIRDGLQSNEPGAETMSLDIVFRLPDGYDSYDRIINAELRVRYLLDMVWRQRRRQSPWIPNLGDNTLNGQILTSWNFCPVPANAREVWSRYSLSYTRIVPKT